MNSRQIIADARISRLEMWLSRQPLNPAFNRKMEAAAAFAARLNLWAVSPDHGAIAPTFHFEPRAKI